MWTDALLSVGVGIGLAAAAGLRVFLPLLVLGIAARLDWIPLAGGFEWVSSPAAIAALACATVLEIAAYYVPWIDNLLDLIAGPLAVAAGVFGTAAVITDLPPAVQWTTAIVAGGGTTAAIKGVMSIARLKSTAFTGGLANPVLSTLEWAGALATSLLAVVLPALAIAVVAFFVVAALRVTKRRALRRSLPRE